MCRSRKISIGSLLWCFCFLTTVAQSSRLSLQGRVSDQETGLPIEQAIVKLCGSNNRILSFAATNARGTFLLSYAQPSSQQGLRIEVSHLAYRTEQVPFAGEREYRFALRPKDKALKEVVVSAPIVRVRGDTLRFLADRFKGEGDHTVEDVLKRIPGIQVAESGAISYQGRAINDFYIEGLDLMGGSYNVATRNLEADMISTVEIIENHQRMAQKRGKEISDNVALNLKLSKKAKLRPAYALSGGYGYAEGVEYSAGILGMLFNPNFQTLTSIKMANSGEQIAEEMNQHYSDFRPLSTLADEWTSGSTAAYLPIPKERYITGQDFLVGSNAVAKLGSHATLRMNAKYIRDEDRFAYDRSRIFYTPTGEMVIEENRLFHEDNKQVELAANYTLNTPKLYFTNIFQGKGVFADNRFRLRTPSLLEESLFRKSYSFQNKSEYSKYNNGKVFKMKFFVGYARSPRRELTLLSSDTLPHLQRLSGSSLQANALAFWERPLGKHHRLRLGTDISYEYNELTTFREWGTALGQNDLTSNRLVATAIPGYVYNNQARGILFGIQFPVGFNVLFLSDKINTLTKDSFREPVFGMESSIDYILTPRIRLFGRASHSERLGSLSGFISAPIQMDYIHYKTGGGIWQEQKNDVLSVGAKYKNPLKFFFANVEARIGRTKSNTSVTEQIDTSSLSSTFASIPTSLYYSGISASTDFFYRPLASKLILQASYDRNKSSVIHQEATLQVLAETYALSGKLLCRPFKWMELSLNGELSARRWRISDRPINQTDRIWGAQLAVFPGSQIAITAGAKWNDRHMIQDAKTRGDFYSMSIKKTSKHWVGTLSFIYSDPGEYRILSLADATATYSKYSLKAYSLSLTLQYRF